MTLCVCKKIDKHVVLSIRRSVAFVQNNQVFFLRKRAQSINTDVSSSLICRAILSRKRQHWDGTHFKGFEDSLRLLFRHLRGAPAANWRITTMFWLVSVGMLLPDIYLCSSCGHGGYLNNFKYGIGLARGLASCPFNKTSPVLCFSAQCKFPTTANNAIRSSGNSYGFPELCSLLL